jgi:hypothetical protein
MGCCGQKRMEFNRESRSSSHENNEVFNDFQPENEKPPKLFEYTGNNALILKGISSGALYHFRSNGEKLEVDHYDSFAMMAERDLKIA